MNTSKENQAVPEVTFRTRQGGEWVARSSADVFADKTVVVFSLPGAFTPTCSSSHVPRYNELAAVFKANGVDEVVCVSVNDAFVMNEWQAQQQAWDITFLPDGCGDFTRGMGMLVNKDELGFGERSWRYSMLVENGVVTKMFVEPQQAGDPFETSDADTMLHYVAPGVSAPLDVVVLTRAGCGHCLRAKSLLREQDIAFDELELNKHYSHRTLRALSGGDTYPQVFIGGTYIGGADQLHSWLQQRAAA